MKTMKTTKASVKKAVEKSGYILEVSVNDVEYKGTGKSAIEVLTDFISSADFPFGVKTSAFIKLSNGKKISTQRYSAIVARRVFKNISHKKSALEMLASKMEGRME
jgi:hypothetical protein